MSDTLYVLAASYDDVGDALAAYESIGAAYRHVGSSHDFDATVIAKDPAGKVDLVRKHDEPTRHGAAVGLNWGLAAGAVAALFPAVGILGALRRAAAPGLHWGVGRARRRGYVARRPVDARAGPGRGRRRPVVVYASEMADRVLPAVAAARNTVNATTNVTAEQLAADIRAARSAPGN